MTGALIYINAKTIIAINEVVISRFGGAIGVRDNGLLESALAQPAQSFDGSDLYPTLSEKGARFAFCLVKNHPFVDGNKRTAAAALAAFLDINGMFFKPKAGKLADVFIAVAASKLEWEGFLAWAENNISETL